MQTPRCRQGPATEGKAIRAGIVTYRRMPSPAGGRTRGWRRPVVQPTPSRLASGQGWLQCGSRSEGAAAPTCERAAGMLLETRDLARLIPAHTTGARMLGATANRIHAPSTAGQSQHTAWAVPGTAQWAELVPPGSCQAWDSKADGGISSGSGAQVTWDACPRG